MEGCMKDSAGKLCLDIMPPRAIANVQKETEDAWADARVPAGCVATSDGRSPSFIAAAIAISCSCVFDCPR